MPDGIIYGMPAEEYHPAEALSKGGLDRLATSPAHFRAQVYDPLAQGTPAQVFGSAAHVAILERERWESRYVVMPEGLDGRTKEGKLWKAINVNRIVLDRETAGHILGMVAAVYAMNTARALLADTEREVSIFWTDPTGAPCKCRPDIFDRSTRIIGDLKTTQSAAAGAFGRDAAKFHYHWQAAWYLDGVKAVTGEDDWSFLFLCVEKAPPYGVAIYTLEEGPYGSPVHAARLQYGPLVELYAQCRRTDVWPGFPDRVQPLTLPAWATRMEDDYA